MSFIIYHSTEMLATLVTLNKAFTMEPDAFRVA
jgi:hypothetical protein